LTGLDTRGSTASPLAVGDETWAAGDILFAHPTVDGKLTNVRPQHDLAVAFITVRHASTGQIAIRIIPGNNHLEWMHDVSLSSPTAGQVLTYNGTLWANASASGGATVSDSAPSSPSSGQIWFESDTGKTFIYYDSSWVQIIGGGGGGGASVTVSDTPPSSPSTGSVWYESDTGSLYLYYDSFWVEVGGSASYNAIIATIQAKGDLLVGLGSQSLDRLSVGSNNQRLIADSAQTTGLRWVADTTNTVVDAAGDLLVGASNDVVARLPVGTNNQALVSDSTATNGVSWQNIVTSGGHSNIFSNSLSTGTATVVSATRSYNGRQYSFNNLTFNMPSNANTDASDWTAPANSTTYKWSYIYIRPSDNKFYISNNAPSAGLNHRTIGGSVCLYLFPAWTSSTIINNFQIADSRYTVQQLGAARSTFRSYETGILLHLALGTGGSYDSGNINVNSIIPATASNVYTGFRSARGVRNDSGGHGYYSFTLRIQDRSSVLADVYSQDGWAYVKTPTVGGAYFLRVIEPAVDVTLSTNTHNFSVARILSSAEQCTNDGDTGIGWWLKGFDDEHIF
jgi:hypothetical protein